MSAKITIGKTSILINNVSGIKNYILVIKDRTFLLRFVIIELILLMVIPIVLSLFVNNGQPSLAYGFFLIGIFIIFLIFLVFIAIILVGPIYLLIDFILRTLSINYTVPFVFYIGMFIIELIALFLLVEYFTRNNSKCEIKTDSIVCYQKKFFKRTLQLLDGDILIFNKTYYMPHPRTENKIITRWSIARRNYINGGFQPIFLIKDISDTEIFNLMTELIEKFKLQVEVNYNHNEIINSNAGFSLPYNRIMGNFKYLKINDDIIIEFKVKAGLVKNFVNYYNIFASLILLLSLIFSLFVDNSLNYSSIGFLNVNIIAFLIYGAFLLYVLYSALKEINLYTNFEISKSTNELKAYNKNFFGSKILFTTPLDQISQFNIVRVNFDYFTLFIQGKKSVFNLDHPFEYYQAQEIIQFLNKNVQASFA